MTRLQHRLLLNAEPFGFGPTAAVAGFFPHLREAFEHVGYVGKKHTLDLQRGLPYNAVHDMTKTEKPHRKNALKAVMAEYDILLTAMDFKVAEAAKEMGLTVIYYDALAWYWPQFPASVTGSDVYIAQDFFGVSERLQDVFARHASAHVVPPIVPEAPEAKARTHVLINLGGLQNPYWPIEDVIDYARNIVGALRRALPADTDVVIAGSNAVAEKLQDMGVRTYARADMEGVLAGSRMAFMTPGLGNIHDAAAFDIPTVWLPPANDSQGQQLRMLVNEGLVDATIDWQDITGGTPIDYKAPQLDVLERIAETATRFSKDITAQDAFGAHARTHFETLRKQAGSRTGALLKRFGRGGEKAVADIVIKAASAMPLPRIRHG